MYTLECIVASCRPSRFRFCRMPSGESGGQYRHWHPHGLLSWAGTRVPSGVCPLNRAAIRLGTPCLFLDLGFPLPNRASGATWPGPFPADDPLAVVLVHFHTPNFSQAAVAWYYVAPGVAVVSGGDGSSRTSRV